MSPTARAAAMAAAVLAADQAAKAVVRASIERGSAIDLVLGFRLVHTENTGIAFGLLAGGGALLIAFAAAALLALLAFFARHRDRPLVWLPTGLLLGGAAGNIVDRFTAGAVTDFLDPPAWPAFNVADAAITIGVLGLLYVLEGPGRHDRR